MSYEDLDIKEGTQAGLAWDSLLHGQLSRNEKAKLRRDLLAYSRQDTEAMVKICEALEQAASGESRTRVARG